MGSITGVNFSDVDETREVGFKLIPPETWEQFQVTAGKVKQGRESGKDYYEMEFTAMGEYNPKKVWEKYSTVGEIGMVLFKKLMIACGHRNPDGIGDTDELLDLEFYGKIGIKKGTNGHPDQNNIKEYRAVNATPVSEKPKVEIDGGDPFGANSATPTGTSNDQIPF